MINSKQYYDHAQKLLEGSENKTQRERLNDFWEKMSNEHQFIYNDNIMTEGDNKASLFDDSQEFWNLNKFGTPLYDHVVESNSVHIGGKFYKKFF
jgi:hypothetical protein